MKLIRIFILILVLSVLFSLPVLASSANIDAGDDFVVAVLKEGTLLGYGDDSCNALKDISSYQNVNSVCAGNKHLTVLFDDKTVSACGLNDNGQCNVSSWKNIKLLGAGNTFSMGCTENNEILIAGNSQNASALKNKLDNLKASSDTFDILKLSVSNAICSALVNVNGENKVVVASSDDSSFSSVQAWKNVIDIKVTDTNIFACKSDGKCYSQSFSNETLLLSSWRNVVKIAACGKEAVGVTDSGRVLTTIDSWYGLSDYQSEPSYWANIIDVAMSQNTVFAVDSNGKIFCATYESEKSECEIGGVNINFTKNCRPKNPTPQIAAGYSSSSALTYDGKVLYAGYEYGTISDCRNWSDIVQIDMQSDSKHIVGLKKDGTVLSAGLASADRLNTSSWKNIAKVYSSSSFSAALSEDGKVYVTGSVFDQEVISRWKNIKELYCGYSYIVAIDCLNNTFLVSSPAYSMEFSSKDSVLKESVAFSGGKNYSLFLLPDGSCIVKKNGSFSSVGQDLASSWENLKEVKASYDHAIGVTNDGKLLFTGKSSNGRLDIDTEGKSVLSAACGYKHSLVLLNDGSVKSSNYTGSSYYGQCDTDGWMIFEPRYDESFVFIDNSAGKISVKSYNNESSSETNVLVIAQYNKDNTLCGVSYSVLSRPNDKKEHTETFDFKYSADAIYTKVFVWESLASMKPVSNILTLVNPSVFKDVTSTLSFKDNSVNVSIKNESDCDVTASLMIASYSKTGKLISLSETPVTAYKNSDKNEFDVDFEIIDNTSLIKAFLWMSRQIPIPLAKSISKSN